MQQYILAYFAIANLAAFCTCAWDKHCAKHRPGHRIPERRLLLLAGLGGGPGLLLGMYTLRHKTRKPKFTLGVPLLLALQLAGGLLFLRQWP